MAASLDQIDFLPASYRQQDRQRHDHLWRGLIAGAFIVGIAAAAAYQQHLRWKVQSELLGWEAPYKAAKELNARLASLQAGLKGERAKAELYTYLRTPWPRSQLLAAIARPLPESIVLAEVRIQREAPVTAVAVVPAPRPGGKPEPAADQPKLDPVEKDLQRLRDSCDKARTIVYLTGETSDPADLHVYLAALGVGEFFSTAQMTSIESLAYESTDYKPRSRATEPERPGEEQVRSRFTTQLVIPTS